MATPLPPHLQRLQDVFSQLKDENARERFAEQLAEQGMPAPELGDNPIGGAMGQMPAGQPQVQPQQPQARPQPAPAPPPQPLPPNPETSMGQRVAMAAQQQAMGGQVPQSQPVPQNPMQARTQPGANLPPHILQQILGGNGG